MYSRSFIYYESIQYANNYFTKVKPINFEFKQWLMIIDATNINKATYVSVREVPFGAWGNVVTKYLNGTKYYIWQDGYISQKMATIDQQSFNLDYIINGTDSHETITMTSNNHGNTYSGFFNNASAVKLKVRLSI